MQVGNYVTRVRLDRKKTQLTQSYWKHLSEGNPTIRLQTLAEYTEHGCGLCLIGYPPWASGVNYNSIDLYVARDQVTFWDQRGGVPQRKCDALADITISSGASSALLSLS